MTFKKGEPRLPNAGRKPGSPNKTTATVRETFENTFWMLQRGNTADLTTWATQNPTEFYKLSSKLIPTDVAVQGALTLQVISGVPNSEDGDTCEDLIT
jgi:hypothetical protein